MKYVDEITFHNDPSKYLNTKDKNITDFIDNLAKIYYENEKNNKKNYQELICMYNIIIENTNKFIQSEYKESKENEVMLCGILSELIWRGYLSKDKKLVYTRTPKEEISSFLGLNVLYGKACCRNLSSIFKDLIKEIKKVDTHIIGNCEYDLSGSFFNTTIERKNENGEIMKNEFFVSYENPTNKYEMDHACIIFTYQDRYSLIYDPTNIRMFATKGIQGKELQGCGKINIQPASLALFNGCDNFQMNSLVGQISKKSLPREKTKNQILDNFQKGINYIVNNQEICEDFYQQITPVLNEVDEYRVKKLLKK